MPPLDLTVLAQIAVDVAKQEEPSLEFIGITSAEGGRRYVELIFASMEHRMPPRVMIGIDRDDSAATVTAHLRTRIRQSLAP